jgi:hypothetical protein
MDLQGRFEVTLRAKLEAAGIVALVILGILFAYEQYQKAVSTAVATQLAERFKQAQGEFDAKLKEVDKRDSDRQKEYEQKSASLQKLTPQQIVVKLPEYVPQAAQPVQVLTPQSPIVQSGQAKEGDALVPAADIKPIAQALLDGNNCLKSLPLCQEKVDSWTKKFNLKQNEAGEWEQAAKGGSVWKRVAKDVVKIGIGVGVGYALPHR